MKHTLKRNNELIFGEKFTIEEQINSTFRWAKVFWIIGVSVSVITSCVFIYLMYAGAQWLMAN